MTPGEVLVEDAELTLNADRDTIVVGVANTGDRPIQVGSHYHFSETNPALEFDRAAALGFRLDIPAGTAVRFEPGQRRTVTLVALAGARRVYGFNARVMGALADRGSPEGAAQADAPVPRSTDRPGTSSAPEEP